MVLVQVDAEIVNTHGDLEDLVGINYKTIRYFLESDG
jgi:hypothetical protein